MGIVITQGDQVTLNLKARDHDLTDATLTTKVLKTDGSDLELENSKHTIDPDQTKNKGKFTIDLLSTDTEQFKEGSGLSIITKVVQGSSIVHYHGRGILTVKNATLVDGDV